MKLMIDTNVILDLLEKREPWAHAAEAVMIAAAEERVECFITASTFTDIHFLLYKHLRDKELVKQALLGLLAVVRALDVNGADCEKAFDLPMPDYEDALLAYCAKRHKMDKIVTRNVKHFENSPVPTITPEALLDLID